jgi:SAM-dependent methyltransferase
VSDARERIYQDLHQGQLKAQEEAGRFSADCIIDIIWQYLQPTSVLDVGCGIGTWLAALQNRGINDLRGVEGPWVATADLACDRALVQVCDLEMGIDLGRRFDLVICLEVAEHLSPQAAERFVASLVKHSSAILFSAAIPFQGGHHHVNEQFLSYWVAHFARHRYQPLDIIRGHIWDDSRVLWWLRQNIVLFAHDDLIDRNERLRSASGAHRRPLSIVHPDIYLSRLQQLLKDSNQFQQLYAYLRTGGVFRASVKDGRLDITKIDDK